MYLHTIIIILLLLLPLVTINVDVGSSAEYDLSEHIDGGDITNVQLCIDSNNEDNMCYGVHGNQHFHIKCHNLYPRKCSLSVKNATANLDRTVISVSCSGCTRINCTDFNGLLQSYIFNFEISVNGKSCDFL